MLDNPKRALEWIHDRIADGLPPAARQEIDIGLRVTSPPSG
jgi:hypothetical protein